MSGGANYGAWEAGIIWGLTHYGNPEDFTWDVVTGVSAGAINAAAVSVFEKGDEVKMAEFLSGAWASLTTDDVWVTWPEGLAKSVLNEPGILDDSPALSFLQKTLEPFGAMKRRFTLAAVNVDTGDYETFDQNNITFEELHQAALSSGSIPGVFPPQHFHDMYLMDGGTVWDVNVDSGIQ